MNKLKLAKSDDPLFNKNRYAIAFNDVILGSGETKVADTKVRLEFVPICVRTRI